MNLEIMIKEKNISGPAVKNNENNQKNKKTLKKQLHSQ
jgi:hypothetical protein